MYHYKCWTCGNIQDSNDPPQIIHICDECGKVDIPLYAIDLYDSVDIPYIIRILKAEQQRRAYYDPVGIKYYWKTMKDEVLPIHKMSASHLENTIRMLERKIKIEENGLRDVLEEMWG